MRSKENNGESGGSNQQQDWSILWSCFENPLSLLSFNNGLPKGMKEMVSNAVSEMRRYYSRKVIDVLIKVTRSSLDMLRKRFVIEEAETITTESQPFKSIFLVESQLMIPNVAIRPTLDELQDALMIAGKNITGVAKGVAQWSSGKEVCSLIFLVILSSKRYEKTFFSQSSQGHVRLPRKSIHDDKRSRRRKLYNLTEDRPQIPHMTKSFYSFVMDNKEVVKMQNLFANCIKSVQPELTSFVKRWRPYHFLWKNDKSTRELMEMDISEFESTLRCLSQLDSNLVMEPDFVHLNHCIAVSTEKLKYGLAVEIKCIFNKKILD